MAALGLIHRTVLGVGPPHFRSWFFPATGPSHSYATRLQARRHSKQLHDYLQGNHTELFRRSLLGQVRVYNNLPQAAVDAPTVCTFQRHLQNLLKQRLREGDTTWDMLFSVR